MFLTQLANTFCGVPMVQAWQDLWLWEQYLNVVMPKTIIELGTGHGGMSLFLVNQMKWRARAGVSKNVWWNFLTVDKSDGCPFLVDYFHHVDILTETGREYLREYLRTTSRPLIMFCDNGDKKQEVHVFSPNLQQGDGLVVHDWGKEITQDDIPSEFFTALELECDILESVTRFFIRS